MQQKLCHSGLMHNCSAQKRILGSYATVSYSRTLDSLTFYTYKSAERQSKPDGKP